MDLDAYFERIGYRGTPRIDEETLCDLHQAHLTSIPYENLDIQMGETKILDEDRFAERLVTQRRGGWCYEMNGLFSCALRELGFTVRRVDGGVVRDLVGDESIGNHMVLLVDLDRRFVADVGLGDGPLHPFPLESRTWNEAGFIYKLERTEDDWWRFHNHVHGLAPRFDFTEIQRELGWYQPQCSHLQESDQSVFKVLAMAFRRDDGRVRALRELTYIEVDGPNKTERRLDSEDDYSRVLGDLFEPDCGLDSPALWKKISERVARRESEAAAAAAAGNP